MRTKIDISQLNFVGVRKLKRFIFYSRNKYLNKYSTTKKDPRELTKIMISLTKINPRKNRFAPILIPLKYICNYIKYCLGRYSGKCFIWLWVIFCMITINLFALLATQVGISRRYDFCFLYCYKKLPKM